jgi:hypothetical protein
VERDAGEAARSGVDVGRSWKRWRGGDGLHDDTVAPPAPLRQGSGK